MPTRDRPTVHPRGRGEQTAHIVDRRRQAVHPRGRGEQQHRRSRHRCRARFIPAGAGNSAADCDKPAVARRFIPAGAGNRLRRGRGAGRAVHPRGRGEQHPRARRHGAYGSSPRARGTGLVARACADQPRFIPAGAGNRARRAPARRARFIPAGAGNSAKASLAAAWPTGSSPRARGTGRAGRVPVARGAVHPRGRGEQSSDLGCIRRDGSSPRARGTARARRLNSAHSGSSPRARGTVECATGARARAGSSPRVRGTGVSHPIDAPVRFIPAGAGNSGLAAPSCLRA